MKILNSEPLASTTPDREKLAGLWQSILSYTDRPQEIFGVHSERLFDRHHSDVDRLPHPGFVGRNYRQGGILFLGMNPGNGTAVMDPGQEPHYEGLRKLRNATAEGRLKAFEALMAYDESWYPSIRIMDVVVGPVLRGTGHGFDAVAFMNVLKWRTQGSSELAPLYRASMAAHTLEQMAGLKPGLIVLLGVGVSKVLQGIPDFERAYGDRCVTIPRTRGDHRLDPKGHEAVAMACAAFRNGSAEEA